MICLPCCKSGEKTETTEKKLADSRIIIDGIAYLTAVPGKFVDDTYADGVAETTINQNQQSALTSRS